MSDPFKNLPLNTQRIYVMEESASISGCEIYIPVASPNMNDVLRTKANLRAWLDSQFDLEPLPPTTTPPNKVA